MEPNPRRLSLNLDPFQGPDHSASSQDANSMIEGSEQAEAARIRQAILEGYRDAIEGRTVRYDGNLRELLRSKCF
jgi:hypothetical protein